jgi:hypothetical protein
MVMADANQVVLHVLAGHDSDSEELADLADQLRGELLELDVTSVAPLSADEVPEGAKGAGLLAGWLVTQFATPDGLRAVLHAIGAWAVRTRRTVEVSIDGDMIKVGNATAEQQQEIVDAWLARHGNRA